jgi:hypothetical protein
MCAGATGRLSPLPPCASNRAPAKVASETEIEAAAAAIANARGGRRGAPAVSNILELLRRIQGGKLFDEVMEDARAALEAA